MITNNYINFIAKQIFKFVLASLFVYVPLFSQSNEDEVVKFRGSLSLSSDLYSVKGIQARQPKNLQRLILRTNFNLFNQIDIPFELYLSNNDTRFLQPFNQFGVSPKISNWLRLHGGYFYSNLSELSYGDIKLYGGGIEFTPGNFRLKAYVGRSRVAKDPDSLRSFGGTYKQNIYAFMIGYGNETKAFLNINLVKAIDDSNSIKPISFTERPIENLVGSTAFGLRIFQPLFIKGEVAASLFSSDITARKVEDVKVPKSLFTPRISSQVDGAAKLNIEIDPQTFWSLRLGTRWIGPGYYTAGYSLLQNDLLEFTFDPALRVLQNKLNILGSIGIRKNNVRNNKLSNTNRFLGMFNADYQITNAFGINLQYNNNQIRAKQYADSLKISNVLNMISISPRFSFSLFNGMNNLSINYSHQNSEDSSPFYAGKVFNKTNSVNFIHSIFFPSTLNLSTSFLYSDVKLSNFNVKIISLNEIVGHQFFNNKLSLFVNLGYSITKVTKSNGFFITGFRANYNLNKFGNFSVYVTNNNFNSSDPLSPSYNELTGSLQYLINF
jgi:hypothetical protein